MTGRPPFLPLYSQEEDIWEGYNFLMEDTRKGYLLSKIVYLRVLDLGAKLLRTKLYWVASPPLLPRAFYKLLANFLATCSISSNLFFVSSNFFHNFWAISLTSFLPILRYLHSVLVDNLRISYEKGARSSPLGDRWWAQDAAVLLGQRFFWTKFKMADVDLHLTDTSVWGEAGHSTILMAHTRICTRLILILMWSLLIHFFVLIVV